MLANEREYKHSIQWRWKKENDIRGYFLPSFFIVFASFSCISQSYELQSIVLTLDDDENTMRRKSKNWMKRNEAKIEFTAQKSIENATSQWEMPEHWSQCAILMASEHKRDGERKSDMVKGSKNKQGEKSVSIECVNVWISFRIQCARKLLGQFSVFSTIKIVRAYFRFTIGW